MNVERRYSRQSENRDPFTESPIMRGVKSELVVSDGWLYLYLRPLNPIHPTFPINGCQFVGMIGPEDGQDDDGYFTRFLVTPKSDTSGDSRYLPPLRFAEQS